MPSVILNGQVVRLQPGALIGKGGEADVFKVDNNTVLKLFKTPKDPDYTGDPAAQQGAVVRIAEQQKKLRAFPKGLPSEVVAPLALAFDKSGNDKVVGYTMPFISGGDVLMKLTSRQYREASGIDGNKVVGIFRELHRVFKQIHAQSVVLGDVNDLNVIVSNGGVKVVDADSMQFAGFETHTFTSRFVDPLRCDPRHLVLARPHNQESDWYAFLTMLMQSQLAVGPYGGVHRPKTGKRLQHDERVLGRVTVFDPSVIYPKPALPLGVLPDDFLDYLHKVYEKDLRGEFPLRYFDNLRWTVCTQCGETHARNICPTCAAMSGYVKAVVTVRGTVTAERVFRTTGRLLYVVNQGHELRYLYHENGAYYREGDRKVLTGELDHELRFRIKGDSTLIGKEGRVFEIDGNGANQSVVTGLYRQILPVFDANQHHSYWLSGNELVMDGKFGPERIGDILSDQTLIWAGESLGFGFFQAGKIVRSFIFNANGRSFNDRVEVPSIPGQLVDATAVFGNDQIWFFATVQDQGSLYHKCYVVDKQGKLLAEASAMDGEDSWLGGGIRGHLAIGTLLCVATDDGIVRLGVNGGMVFVEKVFPDTEPFVNSHTQLVQGREGIHAVLGNEIVLLKIH